MSLTTKLLAASGGLEKPYSDDVFQSFTRTGTGADAVVTTGIDMTKGYMLWSKGRSGATDHAIYDSARGVTLDLASNTTAAQTTQSTGLKSVSTTGHTVGSLGKMNTSAATYVDFVFRKAPKFFDVVTYTGNGSGLRDIPHSLGVAPGMVIEKSTTHAVGWIATHRSLASNEYLMLNDTSAKLTFAGVNAHTATTFRTGRNVSGESYVVYLFAHDASADGIVQCGSFTTDGSGLADVELGWEPQYVLFKPSSTAGNWNIVDTSRIFSLAAPYNENLSPNLSAAAANYGRLTLKATGFKVGADIGAATYVYLAIRRPNKPPTLGTQVYNAIARTGTGAAATVTGVGFAPDLVLSNQRDQVREKGFTDRLRGAAIRVRPHMTAAEITDSTAITAFNMDGVSLGADGSFGSVNFSGTYINHFFKRAVGFHSEICYTGTGSNKTEIHDLGKAPDLMIVKSRSAIQDWNVWCNGLSGTEKLVLNSTAAKATDATAWNSTVPTSSVISLGTAAGTNANTTTYVAYMFSNIAGIQSIGTYVGDGTSGRLINCGFTTGSRYICIKAISATGNWLVADTARGITSGADPYLALNSTAAEVTTEDWLDPSSSGFLVNQISASNANVNGVTYMYWSIA